MQTRIKWISGTNSKYLNGHTGDGSLDLVPTITGIYTGTEWSILHLDSDKFALKCLGDDVQASHLFLGVENLGVENEKLKLVGSTDSPNTHTHWTVDGTAIKLHGANKYLKGASNGSVTLAPSKSSDTEWQFKPKLELWFQCAFDWTQQTLTIGYGSNTQVASMLYIPEFATVGFKVFDKTTTSAHSGSVEVSNFEAKFKNKNGGVSQSLNISQSVGVFTNKEGHELSSASGSTLPAAAMLREIQFYASARYQMSVKFTVNVTDNNGHKTSKTFSHDPEVIVGEGG